MVNEPTTSRYQIVASMTPEELLSEGYVDPDYFYDPDEEEWKKEVKEIERIAREEGLPDEEESIEF